MKKLPKVKLKTLAKISVASAAASVAANVALDLTTTTTLSNEQLTSTIAGVLIAAVALTLLLAWARSTKAGRLISSLGWIGKLGYRALRTPTAKLIAGAWVTLSMLARLFVNGWATLTSTPGHRIGWLDALFLPNAAVHGKVSSAAVMAAAVIVAAVVAAAYLHSYRRVHGVWPWVKVDIQDKSLEDRLMPSLHDIEMLRAVPGTVDEQQRQYLGLCYAKTERGKTLVPLYAERDRNVGVTAPPQTGKFISAVAPMLLSTAGQPHPLGDGHGQGWLGPMIFSTNALRDVKPVLPWRLTLAENLIRQGKATELGVDPGTVTVDPDELAELVSIYDPAGQLADDERYARYRKGWDPLALCDTMDGALRLSKKMVASANLKDMANGDHFGEAATNILVAMLLAAHRSRAHMGVVRTWSRQGTQGAKSPLPKTLASILLRPASDTDLHRDEDATAYEMFDSEWQRLFAADGEKSAVWGTLGRALTAFGSQAVIDSTDPAKNPGMLALDDLWENAGATLIALSTQPGLQDLTGLFAAFQSEVKGSALAKAAQGKAQGAEGRLPFDVLWIADELANVGPDPDLQENLTSLPKTGLSWRYCLQSQAQLRSLFSEAHQIAIEAATVGQLFVGAQPNDGAAKGLVEAMGTIKVTRTSKSKSEGKSTGETEHTERVPAATISDVLTLPKGQSILLYTGMPPLVLRQHRATQSANDRKLRVKPWEDPVMRARLEKGTAEGVKARRLGREHSRRIRDGKRAEQEALRDMAALGELPSVS